MQTTYRTHLNPMETAQESDGKRRTAVHFAALTQARRPVQCKPGEQSDEPSGRSPSDVVDAVGAVCAVDAVDAVAIIAMLVHAVVITALACALPAYSAPPTSPDPFVNPAGFCPASCPGYSAVLLGNASYVHLLV